MCRHGNLEMGQHRRGRNLDARTKTRRAFHHLYYPDISRFRLRTIEDMGKPKNGELLFA
jgi:hypothetical protein